MTITSKIKQAIYKELIALFDGQTAYIMYKNKFDKGNVNFTLPLILIECFLSSDSTVNLGGLTNTHVDFNLHCYTEELNSELSPDNDYSIETEDVFDIVRQHFTSKIFISKEMQSAIDNYSFNFILQSIDNNNEFADAIGCTIRYSGSAHDNTTLIDKPSLYPLETIKQL